MQLPGNATGFGNVTVTVAATTVFLTLNHTIFTPTPTMAISTTSVSSAAAAVVTPIDPVFDLLSQWPQCIVSAQSTKTTMTICETRLTDSRWLPSNLSQLKGLL